MSESKKEGPNEDGSSCAHTAQTHNPIIPLHYIHLAEEEEKSRRKSRNHYDLAAGWGIILNQFIPTLKRLG